MQPPRGPRPGKGCLDAAGNPCQHDRWAKAEIARHSKLAVHSWLEPTMSIGLTRSDAPQPIEQQAMARQSDWAFTRLSIAARGTPYSTRVAYKAH